MANLNSSPIRVLQISDSLKQRFGITSYLLNYMRNINYNRIVFDFLVLDSEPEIEEEIKNKGGRIFYMPSLKIGEIKSYLNYFQYFFSQNHYIIVHSHFYQIDFLVASVALRNGVKHYISHSHNTKYSDYFFRSVRNCIMSQPMKMISTDYCACSEKAAAFLFGKLLLSWRKKKSVVIPNAIDYGKFSFSETMRCQIRDKYEISDCLVFGNVGSLKPQKNHIFLLKVFKKILEIYPKSVLMLVGEGKIKDYLDQLVIEYGIDKKIIFVGTTSTPWMYYNAFDCYLFPSLYEGFGLSLLEAQVNSLGCVCSNTVPDEPIISKYVSKLDLKDDVSKWAQIACNYALKGRNDDPIDGFYNIKDQAENLMRYYENI